MKVKIGGFEKGFTILELVIVIAILGVLAGIVVVAISPGKNLAEGRNSQRTSDTSGIVSAVYQYALDNNGTLPASITTTPTEICATGAASCTGLIDLSVLSANEKYLVSLPKEPLCGTTGGCNANGIGYRISKSANNRVTVSAPAAEQGKTISITK